MELEDRCGSDNGDPRQHPLITHERLGTVRSATIAVQVAALRRHGGDRRHVGSLGKQPASGGG